MIKDIVIKAYNYAEEKHKEQRRKFSDLPYITHPKGVARIIEHLKASPEVIAAALLHDVVEDTEATIEEVETLFGEEVALLVDELTTKKGKRENKADYLIEKMIHMSDAAIMIKLADRLHNVTYLEYDNVDQKFVKRYYNETRKILDGISERALSHEATLVKERIEIILDFLEVRYEY